MGIFGSGRRNMFAQAAQSSGDQADQTANYNTPLSPAEEAAFQQWVRANGRERDLYDYDLRGAWKASVKAASNGHLPDTYKKPNHPTFSAESNYSNPQRQGGNWVPTPGGQWLYFATPDNLRYRDESALQNYFRRVEPDARLVPPVNNVANLLKR